MTTTGPTDGLAARLPPPGLPGLDPNWSRLVTAPDHTGTPRTWHLLDHRAGDADIPTRATLLCVHGNPSWSYLWRRLVAAAPPGVRVIAVDQLDMGFSERTGVLRRLGDRIGDLVALTDHLGITGGDEQCPMITVAHDWGGPISLGWAEHLEATEPGRLQGVVLTNTAVHQPVGSPAPALIRAARAPGILRRVTVDTTTFIRGAIEMSRPRLEPGVRSAFLAPYRTRDRREAIADFVEDIPLDPVHPSYQTLEDVANGLDDLASVPALLLWGPSDLVFSDLYLHDFEARLPHAEVHRFVGASHFVSEEADVVGAIVDWLDASSAPPDPRPGGVVADGTDDDEVRPLWAALDQARTDPILGARPAVVEQVDGATRSIDFAELDERVTNTAAGLLRHGVLPGDRVALMVPPGIDLTVALYACWKMGAVIVLVDSGLGAANMSRALASARPDHLIGIDRAMLASRALRWPGHRILAGSLPGAGTSDTARTALHRTLGIDTTLDELGRLGIGLSAPAAPNSSDLAAIVFTSGSTGPSKGVVYRHHQVRAQCDILTELYAITDDDRLVAAFAPFALYGPALGITSVVPDMDVTRPASLDARALAAAVDAIDATLVFASPAALANVVATASDLDPLQRSGLNGVRLLLSAGAPVNPELLASATSLMPRAEVHTPYGMTEVLPVADISLTELLELTPTDGRGRGVCVGRPAPGVTVGIAPIDDRGVASTSPITEPNIVGEILVSAPHTKDGYDRLAATERASSTPVGWHRSGDVGSLDDQSRLWVGGRLPHVITTASGPLLPVPTELAAESVAGVSRACAVGIGPVGSQALAVVIETPHLSIGLRRARARTADAATTELIRSAVEAATGEVPALVLEVAELPVDRRHNSKIDRSAMAAWAAAIAAGGRITSP